MDFAKCAKALLDQKRVRHPVEVQDDTGKHTVRPSSAAAAAFDRPTGRDYLTSLREKHISIAGDPEYGVISGFDPSGDIVKSSTLTDVTF
jgi:hypothetical protein